MSQRIEFTMQVLQESRDELLAALDRVTDGDWQRPAGLEAWTVRDVLAHLAYSQPSRAVLARNILTGKGGVPADFDLAYFNRRGVEKQAAKSNEELRAQLDAGHAATLSLLVSLTDDDLDKKGADPVAGMVTLAEIFHLTARHDREHARHIRRALGIEAGR